MKLHQNPNEIIVDHILRFFWLLVLISPSCLAASGEKAKKSCSVCAYKFAVADPHPTCLKHNTTCFRHFEFVPEGCIHCSYLIKKFKEGEKKQQAVFLARIDAMQHKVSYLAKTNPDKLPERVKNRFLAGDKNPFAPHMRHLDPRPRTSRSLTRERSSTPLPAQPPPVEAPRAEPDALASAVAQAGIDLFADSSDPPPFQGFESSRASPDYQPPCPESPRHRFEENEYGHDFSRSSSPEPPRKMPRRALSPGPHRSSGPHRPRSRTPRRSPSLDPRGRSPTRPPSWDQVRSMIRESETRMGSALDRMAQTLESLVQQRTPPVEPPRAQAVQEYHPTPRGHDHEDEEEIPGHEEEDPSSYAESRQHTETWEEEREDVDGYPDDPPADEYDPLNPELSIPPEFLNDYFLVPDEAIVYNDYIDFLGNELDTADFEWGTHRGCNTCKPIRWSADIERFLRQAARVTSKPDASESRTKLFQSVTRIIDKPALTHLGLVSHPTKPFTVATSRPSRFLGSLGDDTPFKPPPFTICHQDIVTDRALALDFAAAPKFSRDSHKLPGLLSPHSRELPDILRTKDFKARAHLLSLIHAHESARYASTISDEELKSHKHKESQLAMALRMSERITANHTIPLLQSAITEALSTAVAIRREMRTKALQGCKSNIIRITLQGRSLLCPTLFHPEAVAQAEECARNAPPPPPVLHVNIDGDRLRAQPGSSGKPLHGGGPRFPANRGRGSGPHVSRGWGQKSHRGSASGFRGTRKAPAEKAPFFSSYSGEPSTSYAPEDQSSHRRPPRTTPFSPKGSRGGQSRGKRHSQK